MACRVLCRKLDLPQDQSTGLLKNLMDVYFRRNALHVESESQEVQDVLKKWGTEAAQMVKLRDVALKVLPREPQTRSELEILTGYQGSAFDDEFLSQFPSELLYECPSVNTHSFLYQYQSEQKSLSFTNE